MTKQTTHFLFIDSAHFVTVNRPCANISACISVETAFAILLRCLGLINTQIAHEAKSHFWHRYSYCLVEMINHLPLTMALKKAKLAGDAKWTDIITCCWRCPAAVVMSLKLFLLPLTSNTKIGGSRPSQTGQVSEAVRLNFLNARAEYDWRFSFPQDKRNKHRFRMCYENRSQNSSSTKDFSPHRTVIRINVQATVRHTQFQAVRQTALLFTVNSACLTIVCLGVIIIITRQQQLQGQSA